MPIPATTPPEDHIPTEHTVRRCPICAYKQGLIDGNRRLAICVLIAERWGYDDEALAELVARADRVLQIVEARL